MKTPSVKTFRILIGINLKFGASKSYWSGDFWLSTGEKSHFEKAVFEDMNHIWNLQTQIDEVL